MGQREPLALRRQQISANLDNPLPPPVPEPALAGADEARRQLHAAAVKVQSLFRGIRVRQRAHGCQADATVDDPHLCSANQAKSKGSNVQGYSRGFTAGCENATSTMTHPLGRTNESLPAARLQSRNARRSQSRCKAFLGVEGRDLIRDRRSLSPKMQNSPYARQIVDLGAGSRLQVNGRSAPRR